MKNIQQSPSVDSPTTYQIKVMGKLDESWSDWLEGMAVAFDRGSDGSEVTILTGKIVDQAALHGVLSRIRDLNLMLLSVQLVSPESEYGRDYR